MKKSELRLLIKEVLDERRWVSVNPEYSGRMNVSFGAIKNAGVYLGRTSPRDQHHF